MNIFESLLEEVLGEKVVKVRHGRIKVKHLSAAKRAKAKKFRIKNRLKIKLKAKKRKLKLRSKPRPKKGYSYDSSGHLRKKVLRIGVRKQH